MLAGPQISEHSDEPVREDWLKMFKKMERNGLFPVRSVLPLPDFEATSLLQEVKDDTISMFSHEGTQCLDRLCKYIHPRHGALLRMAIIS